MGCQVLFAIRILDHCLGPMNLADPAQIATAAGPIRAPLDVPKIPPLSVEGAEEFAEGRGHVLIHADMRAFCGDFRVALCKKDQPS